MSRFLIFATVILTGCSARPELPADDGALGAFSLKERSGRTVSNDDLKGKVWIACFVFTRCSGPCPQVTTTMAKLQQELKLADEIDLRLVTITVDPARDDPDELKKYADAFSAHPEKWLFLTGEESKIHELLNKQFGVSAAANPEGKPGDEFAHSTRLVLIDKRGHKRGYFEGVSLLNGEPNPNFEPSQAKLRKAVAALLQERP